MRSHLTPSDSARCHCSGNSQLGSVFAEFLVVASGVLVPLAILLPLLFKFLENRQFTEQAARYAVWERTAYYDQGGVGAVKTDDEIQAEVDQRIFAAAPHPIQRHLALAATETLNPNLHLWDRGSQSMQSLYAHEPSDGWTQLQLSQTIPGDGSISSAVTQGLIEIMNAGASGIDLNTRGVYSAQVSVPILPIDVFPELGDAPMILTRQNMLFADGWTHSPKRAQSAGRGMNIVNRWEDGAIPNALNSVTGILSNIPGFGALSDLELGKVEIDAVPCVRLGRPGSNGSIESFECR